MATVTKKELIDRIAEITQAKRVVVKRIVQCFLDEVVDELARDNRLEFRDFGVFETRNRAARRAQNPKTLDPVNVPSKRTVKFKMGRLMRQRLVKGPTAKPASSAMPDERPSI
ncbi:MAG: integration host factor subunit beta [Sedimentisphaerales bacterium]|nr:integration host factor subunit beta [Sedimentisphaerales bacterium]